MPQRLADVLLPPELARRKIAELSRAARQALDAAVHAHTLRPVGLAGLKQAEVCAGGVALAGPGPQTLQSRHVPGLYMVEVLDVTGLLGGYNLHWAWASGAGGQGGGAAGLIAALCRVRVAQTCSRHTVKK